MKNARIQVPMGSPRMLIVTADAGTYVHSDKEEIAVISKGQAAVALEGNEFILDEGDVVRIPPNIRHHFENRSDEVIQVLFVLTPAVI